MHQTQPKAADREWNSGQQPSRGLRQRLFRALLGRLGDPPIAVELPDGLRLTGRGPLVGTIRVRSGWPWWRLCWNPIYEFGEAYARGDLEIEGDLAQLLTSVYVAMNETRGWRPRFRLWRAGRKSLRQSRYEIHHHYDIRTDFYKLWLDRQLVYTCAYFPHSAATLEEAQTAKLDYVCRKLRLRPGERVVEAGCGWGALALHMARHYGVRVRAFNISREQLHYARHQARQEGLDALVDFVDGDWRCIDEPCDAFVSVGMLEHVGRGNYERLGAVMRRCLAPQGRGLVHSIGQTYPQPLNPWITRRIFPGAYPPSLAEMMRIFEPNQLTVLDVENLRPHYASTLRCWLDRYEQASGQVREMFDETFVRLWRLYLAGSLAAFQSGSLQLFQVVFTRAPHELLAWTRDDLYRDAAPVEDFEQAEEPA